MRTLTLALAATVFAVSLTSLTSPAQSGPARCPAAAAAGAVQECVVVIPGQGMYQPDGSQLNADFDGDGFNDIAVWEVANAFTFVQLSKGGAGGMGAFVTAWSGSSLWLNRVKHVTAGDYNGDGKSELAFFYEQTDGYSAVYTMTFNTGNNSFNAPVLKWEAPSWGVGTRFLASGYFSGISENRADIVMFYQYDNNRIGIFRLLSDIGGGFVWTAGPELASWGPGTKAMVAVGTSSANISNIALQYDYGGGHIALWTLHWDALSLTSWAMPWDGPVWGGGTRFVRAGNFAGDTVADLLLFYNYGGGHVAAFVLTATGQAYTPPTLLWNGPTWGGGTQFLTVGNYVALNERDELGMYYNYGNGTAAMTTLAPVPGGYNGPWVRWTSSRAQYGKTGI
ncbi:FG-GAP repeat domain-containing protein [Longispora albida]|uniref:FG-GAP repeat domain-containing protein n=1 Tax=Longispora albida TaxID=203523 RepID=UPI0003A1F3EB|nr:VCBS repeat-containing protein [Longispora albida]